jgi:ABC-type multidrug transport system ATPase subunit
VGLPRRESSRNNVWVGAEDVRVSRLGSEKNYSTDLFMNDVNIEMTKNGGITLQNVLKVKPGLRLKPQEQEELLSNGEDVRRGSDNKDRAIILNRVSFDIPAGEIYTMLGKSGSGKTCLVGILSGRLRTTDGLLWSWGNSLEKSRFEIISTTNVCLQHDCLWEELTVYDHFTIILMLKGLQELDI